MEADEYAGNFDPYVPDIAVLISAEWDHPDVFPDETAVVEAFHAWVIRAGTLVVNRGDHGAERVVERLGTWPGRRIDVWLSTGEGPDPSPDPAAASTLVGRIVREDAEGTELEISGLRGPGMGRGGPEDTEPVDRVRLRLLGRHLAIDGLMAAGGALAVGVDPDSILAGLASFEGVGRRFRAQG